MKDGGARVFCYLGRYNRKYGFSLLISALANANAYYLYAFDAIDNIIA